MLRAEYPEWLMDRFWAKVDKGDDCWVWTASQTGSGYGQFRDSVREKRVDTHRFVYEACVGPIPTGLVIDHHCRNKLCVNPAHLEAVTDRVNVLRSSAPPALNEMKTHCPQGHPLSGDNLYRVPDGSRKCRQCHRDRVRDDKMRVENISENQFRRLKIAVRNGRWWISGKGSNRVVEGLVSRGLAEKRYELVAGRLRPYLVATSEGGRVVELRTRRGA